MRNLQGKVPVLELQPQPPCCEESDRDEFLPKDNFPNLGVHPQGESTDWRIPLFVFLEACKQTTPRCGSGQRRFHTLVMLPKFATPNLSKFIPPCADRGFTHGCPASGWLRGVYILKPSETSRSSTSCPVISSCVFRVGCHVDSCTAGIYGWQIKRGFFWLSGGGKRGGDSHLNHLRALGENYVALQVSPPTSHRFAIPLGPPVHNHCTKCSAV